MTTYRRKEGDSDIGVEEKREGESEIQGFPKLF